MQLGIQSVDFVVSLIKKFGFSLESTLVKDVRLLSCSGILKIFDKKNSFTNI